MIINILSPTVLSVGANMSDSYKRMHT